MESQGKDQRPRSRKLGIVEYYEALQIEWIVANLRHRIYPEDLDKKYYERVMFGKYETINKISNNNQLPSIFTDQDYKHDLEQRVYKEGTHPLFIYTGYYDKGLKAWQNAEQHKIIQEPKDLQNYYAIDSDVRCSINEEQIIGKITEYIPYAHNITVLINGKKEILSIKQVTRIL